MIRYLLLAVGGLLIAACAAPVGSGQASSDSTRTAKTAGAGDPTLPTSDSTYTAVHLRGSERPVVEVFKFPATLSPNNGHEISGFSPPCDSTGIELYDSVTTNYICFDGAGTTYLHLYSDGSGTWQDDVDDIRSFGYYSGSLYYDFGSGGACMSWSDASFGWTSVGDCGEGEDKLTLVHVN